MKITFLRSGATLPHAIDLMRELLDEEYFRATCIQSRPGATVQYDLIIVSEAERARQTAMALTGVTQEVLVPYYSLYQPVGDEAAAAWYRLRQTCGTACLRAYYATDTQNVLVRYAQATRAELLRCITLRKATQVLIVGHKVLLSALVHTWCGESHQAVTQILDTVLEPFQGFTICGDGGSLPPVVTFIS